jgi:uncharacterized protein (TIGR04255 family)
MPWDVPKHEHRVFPRNPLVGVLVELRFFPVLKIGERVADFQEVVRSRFPIFRHARQQIVSVGPGPVELRSEEVFSFSKADDSAVISLASSSISLDSRRHRDRDDLIDDVLLAIRGLSGIASPLVTQRLGLRYVNLIDRDQVARDLGLESVAWSGILQPRFCEPPTGLVSAEGSLFACEVTAARDRGAQTLRYGIIRDADGRVKAKVDVDRYLEGQVDTAELKDLLRVFSAEIFSLFMAAAGPDLRRWMENA